MLCVQFSPCLILEVWDIPKQVFRPTSTLVLRYKTGYERIGKKRPIALEPRTRIRSLVGACVSGHFSAPRLIGWDVAFSFRTRECLGWIINVPQATWLGEIAHGDLVSEMSAYSRLIAAVSACWAHVLSNATKWSLARFPFGGILRLCNLVYWCGFTSVFPHSPNV